MFSQPWLPLAKIFIQLDTDCKEIEIIKIDTFWLMDYERQFYFLYCYTCCLYNINRYDFHYFLCPPALKFSLISYNWCADKGTSVSTSLQCQHHPPALWQSQTVWWEDLVLLRWANVPDANASWAWQSVARSETRVWDPPSWDSPTQQRQVGHSLLNPRQHLYLHLKWSHTNP